MAEARVEVVVLHLGVRLVEFPVVHIEPVDGAHNSRAVTAAGAVREELAGCGIVDEFQKSINRLLLRVAGIAHRNIDVAHPEGFHITLLIVAGEDEKTKKTNIFFIRIEGDESPNANNAGGA